MITKAMVLAAGLGLRMRPLTDNCPKPLIKVAGKPLIDYTLDWLAASGVESAVVNTHYKAEMLAAHVAGRHRPRISLSHEETVLETGGGIRQALPLLGAAPFFSVNSDTICIDGSAPALHRLQQHWNETEMEALLLVQPVSRAVGYEGAGDFFVENGTIRRRLSEASAPFVFTGVQILHPKIFAGAPAGPFSLNLLYNRAMAADGTLNRVRALAHDGDWLHIGDAAGLAAAEAYFGRVKP